MYQRRALLRKELSRGYCFKFSLFLQKSLQKLPETRNYPIFPYINVACVLILISTWCHLVNGTLVPFNVRHIHPRHFPGSCGVGQFCCSDWNTTCINDTLVCDGTRDCPNGADEQWRLCNRKSVTYKIYHCWNSF